MQFSSPKKMKFPLTDKFKYCKFYRDYSHDTNDCVTLKDESESLTIRGKLANNKHYSDQHKEGEKERVCVHSYLLRQKESSSREDRGAQQILGTIETILEGFVGRGTLNNAQKRHLQAIINVEHNK